MSDTELVTDPPQPQPSQKSFLFGPNGLRAGWRVLIFLMLMLALGVIAGLLLRFVLLKDATEFSARNVILSESLSFVVVLLAAMVMGKFEERSIADYGLPPGGFLGKQFWTGAVWGFVMLSFIVALMAATHSYQIVGLAIAPVDVLKYGFLWAVGFLLVGLFEEFTFRGYMQFTLTNGMGFWPAAGITCTVFALGHSRNPGESPLGIIEIVLIALFLCMALRRTGNLWFAIGWHMAFDWGESFFYSTPNSGIQATGHMLKVSLNGSKWLNGGSVGPEASVFDLIVTVAGILLLAKLYPEAKYPMSAPLPAQELGLGQATTSVAPHQGA